MQRSGIDFCTLCYVLLILGKLPLNNVVACSHQFKMVSTIQ